MTGIILAGGKNSRIQTEKALLKLGSITIIEHILNVTRPLFQEVMVVTNSPARYLHLDCRLVPDLKAECGPLGGIHSGLFHSQDEYNFFFACDMPFLNKNLICFMMKESPGYDVTIPLTSRGYETLHAIYNRSCLVNIERLLEQGDFKILNFFPEVKIRAIEEVIIKQFDPQGDTFFNINTRDDYSKAKKMSGGED